MKLASAILFAIGLALLAAGFLAGDSGAAGELLRTGFGRAEP